MLVEITSSVAHPVNDEQIMTNLKRKKRMMYAVFALIFVFGGVEYAVILPTLWLYLHTVYEAPEYMLGLVLSAYSLAALFSAPIIGRISDRIGCTKQIFIVCAIFELAGSFLYFIEISQWLCLGSRFVSGMGAASEAVALAEVSKYTAEKERTAIISYLVAMRQIALLFGPGLNAFLRLANFKIGPFDVNKYTAPGAFMVIMWALLVVIVLLMYTEPRNIYALEKKEQQYLVQNTSEQDTVQEDAEGRDGRSREAADSHVSFQDSYTEESNTKVGANLLEQSTNSEHETEAQRAFQSYDSFYRTQEYPSDSDGLDKPEFVQSGDEGPFVFPPVSYHSAGVQEVKNDSGQAGVSTVPHSKSDYVTASEEYHEVEPWPESKADFKSSDDDDSIHQDNHFYHSCQLSSSLDLLISAERIINESQYSRAQKEDNQGGGGGGGYGSDLVFNEDHFGINSEDLGDNVISERSPLRRSHKVNMSSSQSSLMKSYGTNGSYIERSTSCLDDPIAIEGRLGFFCNEYIRDEIMAIICLLFCAMFSQVCVETMVLPLALIYLDFDELENSLLYCVCGVEIIIAFLLVSRISRRFSDRAMMMFGAVVLLAANIWLICFLPTAPPHNRAHNLPIFAVAVFLDILSLPFLLVCSTSLFSKLTRKQTQGLSQGLRRGVVGLGTVIAPLWGSSSVNNPYLQLGVLIGIQGLSLILCVLSYKRLKVAPTSATLLVSPSPPPTTASPVVRVLSNSSLIMPTTNNSSNSFSHSQRASHKTSSGRSRSTAYGSIQISAAESSYHSLGMSVEHQPLLSDPHV